MKGWYDDGGCGTTLYSGNGQGPQGELLLELELRDDCDVGSIGCSEAELRPAASMGELGGELIAETLPMRAAASLRSIVVGFGSGFWYGFPKRLVFGRNVFFTFGR